MTDQSVHFGTVEGIITLNNVKVDQNYQGFAAVNCYGYQITAYIPWQTPLIQIGEVYTLTKIGLTYALGQRILSE